MRIDANQIVNMPFEDVQEIIARAVDAESDLANCQAALLASEGDVRRKAWVIRMVSGIAAFWFLAAMALLAYAFSRPGGC
jgi:hypothetical protein